MEAAASAFGLIFAAEIGDKSMLLVLFLATRHPWWLVLAALTAAVAGLMALAVGLGGAADAVLPDDVLAFVAAAIFVIVGVWALRTGVPAGPADGEDGRERHGWTAFAVIVLTFALAELGDKTQIAALSLSGLNPGDLVGVWAGASAGLIVADGLVLVIGRRAARALPSALLGRGAGLLFIGVGIAAAAVTALD